MRDLLSILIVSLFALLTAAIMGALVLVCATLSLVVAALPFVCAWKVLNWIL